MVGKVFWSSAEWQHCFTVWGSVSTDSVVEEYCNKQYVNISF